MFTTDHSSQIKVMTEAWKNYADTLGYTAVQTKAAFNEINRLR